MIVIRKQKKATELLQQWANLQNNLVYVLVEMKKINGSVGTKRFLKEALSKFHIGSSTSGGYLMRLVMIAEKLQRIGLNRRISDQIPLASWMKIIKFVSLENAEEIVDYLLQDGQLKILLPKLEQGYEPKFNLYSGDFEFTKRDKKNGNL